MEIDLVFNSYDRPVAVTRCSEGIGKWVFQSGQFRQFAYVKVLLQPDRELQFSSMLSWEVDSSKIPVRFLDGVLQGIKQAFEGNSSRGTHLIKTRVRVVDGAFDEIDSSARCYAIATRMAMQEALSANTLEDFPTSA